MISLLSLMPDYSPSSFIRFDCTIFLSFKPALMFFHCSRGSTSLLLFLFSFYIPNSLNMSCFPAVCGAASSRIWELFFLGAVIAFANFGLLPLIRYNKNSTVSSVMPSLPQRCRQHKLWALVRMGPNYRIASAGRPVALKSRWIKWGLYLIKSLKSSIIYWLFHVSQS